MTLPFCFLRKLRFCARRLAGVLFPLVWNFNVRLDMAFQEDAAILVKLLQDLILNHWMYRLSLCNYNTNLWCTKLSVWKTKLSDGTHVDCRLHILNDLRASHTAPCPVYALDANLGTLKLTVARFPCISLPRRLKGDPLGYRPKLLPAKKMGCWNSEKVTLSQQQCFPTTAGQLSLPNMAAFGGSKDSRVFVASGIKHAWTWSDQLFQIFNLTDGGSLVQKKDSRKVAQLTQKKAFGLFWRLGCI